MVQRLKTRNVSWHLGLCCVGPLQLEYETQMSMKRTGLDEMHNMAKRPCPHLFLFDDDSSTVAAAPPKLAVRSSAVAKPMKRPRPEELCYCQLCKHELLCDASDLPDGARPIVFVPE